MSERAQIFSACTENWYVAWSADQPYLQGTPEIIAEIEDYLLRNSELMVTPTGPSIGSELSDPFAVALAIIQIFGDEVEFTNMPDFQSLWDDGSFPDDAVY